MKELLNDKLIRALQAEIAKRRFPGISFENAMTFILTDGVLPASNLSTQSFLDLEDWVRAQSTVAFSTTDLKNKTGEVLEHVARGKTVRLTKHGRVIAEIKPVS